MNKRLSEGRTPLHWACFYGKLEFVRELTNVGADHDTKDDVSAPCTPSPPPPPPPPITTTVTLQSPPPLLCNHHHQSPSPVTVVTIVIITVSISTMTFSTTIRAGRLYAFVLGRVLGL